MTRYASGRLLNRTDDMFYWLNCRTELQIKRAAYQTTLFWLYWMFIIRWREDHLIFSTDWRLIFPRRIANHLGKALIY
jgi:hypothetical protein